MDNQQYKMVPLIKTLLLTLLLIQSTLATTATNSNSNNNSKRIIQHFEPQIACPPPPQSPSSASNIYTTPSHLTSSGQWSPLPYTQLTCPSQSINSKKRKLTSLLRLCQKAYPGLDIVNIVESTHVTKVLFCNKNSTSCGHKWVNGWRCLESPFQSEALLVPSPCLFDHIHNSSKCMDSSSWNSTALNACSRKGQTLKSFAVLLPCGIGQFTGVEFVCCPVTMEKNNKKLDLDEDLDDDDEDDEDDYDDDDDDDDEDDYETITTSTTTSTTPLPTVDPYFKKYDTVMEHENFLDAGERLESVHKLRINHVMEDWGKLEEKYQKLRESDPKGAEEFKKQVTERFQKTVQSLEEESLAEKKQLIAVHQQRVLSHLNERKKEAMECFTRSLNERPQIPRRIRKCTERLLRTLHKERHHTLQHATLATRPQTIEKLGQLSNTAKESLRMIERYPKLYTELKPLIEDYVLGLQGSDDPVHNLLTSTRGDDIEVVDKIVGYTTTTTMGTSTTTTTDEPIFKDMEDANENEDDVDMDMTKSKLIENNNNGLVKDEENDNEELDPSASAPIPVANLYEENEIGYSHATYNAHNIGEVTVRRESLHKENKVVYVTLAFAGVAVFGAIVIGLIVLRRGQSPRGQGFSEVSTTAPGPGIGTPEEKHVANMQINGYENPTYRYFEVGTSNNSSGK